MYCQISFQCVLKKLEGSNRKVHVAVTMPGNIPGLTFAIADNSYCKSINGGRTFLVFFSVLS